MSPVSEPHDLAATSLFYVFGLVALALLSLGGVVYAVLLAHDSSDGAFVMAAVFWVGFSTSAWGIYRTCYRVEVSDGYLVMQYLYRRRVVRLEKVRRIELIEPDEESSSPAKFEVSLDDGSSFRVTANRSTRPLMEAIVRGQPDILVVGQISPPTKPRPWTKPPPMSKLPPRTQEDNEFWSGRGRD
jgi:hypothetical protein